MLSYTELQNALDRVTYRPGWEFKVYPHKFEGHRLVILARHVEDSYQPGKFLDLGIRSPLPPMRDEEALYEWLAWRLGIIENHEMREWLKVDGKPHFDPHAEEDRTGEDMGLELAGPEPTPKEELDRSLFPEAVQG